TTVTAVAPNSIPFGTDTHIIITGTNFVNVRSVFPAADFNVNPSATSISAHMLSDLPAGCYNIEVRTDAGVSSPPNTVKFCVTPIVMSIDPTSGPFTGGTNVTVRGAGFSGGTDFLFGDKDAGPAECTSTSCSFVTPPGSPGDADVKACVGGACSATAAKFHYTGPT